MKKQTSRRRALSLLLASSTSAAVWLIGSALAAPQAEPPTRKKTSDTVFKNVQVMKNVPVDDFMGTMGIMCAALGFDCSDCHEGAGTEKVDWAADTPRKIRARGMVRMMTAINRDNFAGRQVVTCWTCHHGRDHPSTSPTLEYMYGPASQEMDDVLTQMPGQPAADQILEKYIQAIGGAELVSGLKSYAANGASVGFGGFGGGGEVEIFARFPDGRAMLIEYPKNPDRHTTRTYDGREGWLETLSSHGAPSI